MKRTSIGVIAALLALLVACSQTLNLEPEALRSARFSPDEVTGQCPKMRGEVAKLACQHDTARFKRDLPQGSFTLTIRARTEGRPSVLAVLVDGEVVSEVTVESETFKQIEAGAVALGEHAEIALRFVNDKPKGEPGVDNDVFVKEIRLERAAADEPTGGAPGPDEGLAEFEEQALEWTACPESTIISAPEIGKNPELSDRIECATLITPLDWANPGAGQLDFAIARLRAANEAEREGAIFFNPGGPGSDGLSAGIDFGLLFAAPVPEAPAAELLSQVSERHDIVGFTPRGVGEASLLTCSLDDETNVDDFFANLPDANFYTDRSEENVLKLLEGARLVADLCEGDPLAPYITTEQTARDMDLVRRLLEDEKLNYFGYSYGTWLGTWYAKLFPGRVGNMVLDSNVNFSATWQDVVLDFAKPSERAFRDVAIPYVARNDELYGLGTDVEAIYDLYDTLPREYKAAFTLELLNLRQASLIEENAFALIAAKGIGEVLDSLENPEDTDDLVEGLEAYTFAEDEEVNERSLGSARALVEVAGSFAEAGILLSESILADQILVATAVLCNDTPWTRDPDFWAEQGDELNERYPLNGGLATFEPCAFWPFPSAEMPDTPGRLPSILMLQNGYDVATPTEGALQAFESLPNAKFVYIENELSHLVFPYNTPCVDTAVAAYLLNGTLPEEDVTNCPAKPLPGEDQVYAPGTAPSAGTQITAQGAYGQTAEPGPDNPLYERLREHILEGVGLVTIDK